MPALHSSIQSSVCPCSSTWKPSSSAHSSLMRSPVATGPSVAAFSARHPRPASGDVGVPSPATQPGQRRQPDTEKRHPPRHRDASQKPSRPKAHNPAHGGPFQQTTGRTRPPARSLDRRSLKRRVAAPERAGRTDGRRSSGSTCWKYPSPSPSMRMGSAAWKGSPATVKARPSALTTATSPTTRAAPQRVGAIPAAGQVHRPSRQQALQGVRVRVAVRVVRPDRHDRHRRIQLPRKVAFEEWALPWWFTR